MRFLNFLFASKKSESPDTLGAYPEGMQVRALPERRYLKTSRFLAVIILLLTMDGLLVITEALFWATGKLTKRCFRAD